MEFNSHLISAHLDDTYLILNASGGSQHSANLSATTELPKDLIDMSGTSNDDSAI
jgi:hypothetical protein